MRAKSSVVAAVLSGVVAVLLAVVAPAFAYHPGVQVPRPLGYRLVASDGGIFAFGGAGYFGSMGGRPLARPMVGIAATPSGKGYWTVASDGGIFAFGDAGWFGSLGGVPLASPIVGMASTPSGVGYWLVASDGGVFAFGDAGYFGSLGGIPLASPIVGLAGTASGQGYWLAGADGGVFAFGDAVFHDSGAGILPRPIVGIARSPELGYWLVDTIGSVFHFGEFWVDVPPFLAPPDAKPIVGMAPTGSGQGAWVAATDGGVFALHGSPFLGSAGGLPLVKPIVGIAAAAAG
jgi:hypothetical protein